MTKTLAVVIVTNEAELSLSVRVCEPGGAFTEATDSGFRGFYDYASRQVEAAGTLEFREWLVAAVLDRLSGDALRVRSE